MSELRNFDSWQQSLRCFDWLSEHVSGAMDVDALIERNGQFLVFEGKTWSEGIRMPYGQHRSLYKLSQLEQFRVYLVGEGKEDRLHVALVNTAPKPVYIRKGNMTFWPPDRFVPTTRDALGGLAAAWWRDAGEAAGSGRMAPGQSAGRVPDLATLGPGQTRTAA